MISVGSELSCADMISDQVTVLHCTVSLLTCPTTMGHVPRADLCVLLRFLVKIEKIQRQTDHYLSIRLETFSRGVEMSHFVGGIWCVLSVGLDHQ